MLDRSPVQFRFGCLFPQDATGQSSVAERAGTRMGNCRAGSPNPALVSVCSLYRPAGTRVSHPPLRFRAKRIAFDHLRLSAPSAFRFQVSAVRSQCSSLPPPPSRFNPQAPGTKVCQLHLNLILWAGRPRPAMRSANNKARTHVDTPNYELRSSIFHLRF